MAKFYAKSTNGFYDSAINPTRPSDAVPVSDAAYDALMASQAQGQIIQADANGNPVAVAVVLTAAQEAANAGFAALASGVNIVSQSMPALNGTYSLSSNTMIELSGMMAYTEAKGAFPGGASSIVWADVSGIEHTFSSVAEFQAFAEAICVYVTQIQEYINSGSQQGSIPPNNVSIP